MSDGETSDFKGRYAMVDDNLSSAKVFIADRGYNSDHIRSVYTRCGGTPVMLGRINRNEPTLIDVFTNALRNRVERCFNKLKCSRRLATHYKKTPQAISALFRSQLPDFGGGTCQHDLDKPKAVLANLYRAGRS